jgi:hypothetical protein
MSSNPLTNVADNNTETLNYIQELQTIEQSIYTNLEQNGSSMTQAEQNQLISQMNDVSQMRINLYKSLTGMNNLFQNALTNSRDTLDEQIVAIKIVENQLNEAKSRLKSLEDEKNNNIRHIEINDYYAERYEHHTQLMKYIIFMLVPIIILAILYNKGILPRFIYLGLVMIIAFIGFYFIWNTYFSMMRRDNMSYQEYNFPFDSTKAPSNSGGGMSFDPWSGGASDICVGAQCCNQYELFDASLNKCLVLTGNETQAPPNSISGTNINSTVSNDFNTVSTMLSNKLSNGVNSLTSGLYGASGSM